MTTDNRENERRLVYKWVDSPVGRLKLVATDDGLAGILWESERPGRVRLSAPVEEPSHTVLVEAERQLREYFHGRRRTFRLTLDFAGTAFQRQVWTALLTIPFGETRSYAQIARQIGKAERDARRRRGERPESHCNRGPLPSRHRRDRQADRVRRRPRGQGLPAGPRGRRPHRASDRRRLTPAGTSRRQLYV